MVTLDTAEQKRQKDLERLHSLRPMDDDFMRCLFKDNIPLAEMVLRIITGKPDLVITDCQTQKDMKRLAGRVLSAWTHTEQILSGKSMIWKSSGRIRVPTRTEQDFIPVCWILKIWMLGRNFVNCLTHIPFSSPKRTFTGRVNQFILLSG